MSRYRRESPLLANRQTFIGGSDVRIILGGDESALLRLWQEKRGEIEPQDLSGNLVVQLGVATEELKQTRIGKLPHTVSRMHFRTVL